MAAHGLTIMRQIKRMIVTGRPVEDVTRHTDGGLSAPGTCLTVGFPFELWCVVERANTMVKEGRGTLEGSLLQAVEQAITTTMWMDAYPCMEAIEEAIRSYVRLGKPYATKRMEKFETGDVKAHAVARKAIEVRYPLAHRAPVIEMV